MSSNERTEGFIEEVGAILLLAPVTVVVKSEFDNEVVRAFEMDKADCV
jgi:hypothetical protein